MPYLIDGHNLIPKLGLRLDSFDDEMELTAILQEFCRLERKQVDVYFDGAPTPHAGIKKLGVVTAHFVPLGTTADDAIRRRLKKMGKTAKNWIVVSSDRQVQADVRAAGASTFSSDTFAEQVAEAMRAPNPQDEEQAEISEKEIEEWMHLFRENKR